MRIIVSLVFLIIFSGCAGPQLKEISKPPPSSKIRICLLPTSGPAPSNGWKTSHHHYGKMVYDSVQKIFSESGIGEVVPLEDVKTAVGRTDIPADNLSKDMWKLAVQIGKAVHAEYTTVVERGFYPKPYFKIVLINVGSNKAFWAIEHPPAGHRSAFEPVMNASYTKIFQEAHSDLLATATQKGMLISKDIAETKKELEMIQDRPTSQQKTSLIIEKNEELSKLNKSLVELERLKKSLEAEKMKLDQLSKELAEQKQREQELLNQISEAKKLAPVLAIASPMPDEKTESKFVTLKGVVEDDKGIDKVEVHLNDKLVSSALQRGIAPLENRNPARVYINQRIDLNDGVNHIRISAVDHEGLSTERIIHVQKITKRRNVWAVVIGINSYPNVPALKYAVNDAKAFYQILINVNRVPEENVTLLLESDATLANLRSTLGTILKQKADKKDTVIIYFAGHGATERDAMSPDGDGLEKYILPYNADLDDLYASAIPMREIAHIFNRIQSDRLIFIADACYSGASGGRTVGAPGFRANISDEFLERISQGKGRIILTASDTNEVSVEDDKLQHGVFTYFLIEGLRGSADLDQDGLIHVDEAYRYVSTKVKQVTGQRQHPLKKGTVAGNLVLGIAP